MPPLYTVDYGLAKSYKHSTTEWLYSLWSHSTPISLCYKLCLHAVSADHLLVQQCLLKTKMTERGGGRAGYLSGVVLVRMLASWLERWDTAHVRLYNFGAEFLHWLSPFSYLCAFFLILKLWWDSEEERTKGHTSTCLCRKKKETDD